MTVLQVCAFAAPNAGNFIACLTKLEFALEAKGIKTVYAFADGAEDKPWCKEIQRRTDVYFLPTANARILPQTYQIFRKIYTEQNVSIVHSHFELYDIPATVTAPKDTKVIWHLHDALKLNYSKDGAFHKLLTRFQYACVGKRAQLLSVSKEHAKFAVQLGFPKKQVVYFPNGIHTERIHKTPQRKKENQFLMFGWEVQRKGVDLVVAAAEQLPKHSCKIVIIGQDECRAFLAQHGTSDIVEFHEPVDDVNTLFQTSKAFLHVSRAEGLSYALLEAIYAGLPVICSDIEENRFAEVFQNVFFIPSEDSEAITKQLEALIQWDGTLSAFSVEANRTIIEDTYSVEAWIKKLIAIYLE